MEISFEISRYPLLEMISENLLCAAEFHRNMASLYGVIVRNETKDGKFPAAITYSWREWMKEEKQFKKMALRAIVSAQSTPDPNRAQELKNLAKGFQAQAKAIKRSKKNSTNRRSDKSR